MVDMTNSGDIPYVYRLWKGIHEVTTQALNVNVERRGGQGRMKVHLEEISSGSEARDKI